MRQTSPSLTGQQRGVAYKALDVAISLAYGWTDYTPEMADDEILRRLLALNHARASGQN